MTNDELCYLSATEALDRFRARKLSPRDLVSALIERAAAVNPAINCLADRYFEEALAQAGEAEQRYMKNGRAARPLEGVPVAVKDAQRVGGKRTTQGSLIFKDHVDHHSDPMIERLQEAGAIIIGRTTTPEFCLSGVTHSRIWGVTRNPWNIDYGPGGSSGGSGAALAAGLAPLATGTDIGGSIRIPASSCGIVGYKPPHGRNPDGPPGNHDRFNHCGPMTRTIADAALMQTVTSGAHPLDHDSLRESVRLPLAAGGIKGMKLAWSIDFGYVEVDPDVRRNTLNAVEVFRSLGAVTEEVKLDWTSDILGDCLHWYNAMEFGRQTVWHRQRHGHLMTDYALKMADAVAHSTIEDVHKPLARAHTMYQTLGPILASHDVFLCPNNSFPAVKADHDPWDRNFTVNGKPADPEFGWIMSYHFNMLHNCPVLAVPSGFASSGVPTGIQIVARSFDDARVFRAGLAYEKALGGWYTSPEKRPALRG